MHAKEICARPPDSDSGAQRHTGCTAHYNTPDFNSALLVQQLNFTVALYEAQTTTVVLVYWLLFACASLCRVLWRCARVNRHTQCMCAHSPCNGGRVYSHSMHCNAPAHCSRIQNPTSPFRALLFASTSTINAINATTVDNGTYWCESPIQVHHVIQLPPATDLRRVL